MKVGETNAVHMSFFTSMVEVAKAIFPADDKKKKPITEDLSKLDPDAWVNRMNQLGKMKE